VVETAAAETEAEPKATAAASNRCIESLLSLKFVRKTISGKQQQKQQQQQSTVNHVHYNFSMPQVYARQNNSSNMVLPSSSLENFKLLLAAAGEKKTTLVQESHLLSLRRYSC